MVRFRRLVIVALCAAILSFGFFAESAFALTISGRVYANEGTTQLTTAGKTIMARFGTSTAGFFATTTVALNGFWQIQNVTATDFYLGMPIHVWVDGDSTFRAFAFTKASSTANNITGLDLYKNTVIVKHEGFTGTSTTNADLGVYDADDNGSIQFRVTGSNIAVNAANTLYVAAGSEFKPGGTITLFGNAANANGDGDLRLATGLRQDGVASTSILTMESNALDLAGNWYASSTATFRHAGIVTFNSSSTGNKLIFATSSPFYDLSFSGTGPKKFAADATTTGFTIGAGTTVVGPPGLAVGGSLTIASGGVLTHEQNTTSQLYTLNLSVTNLTIDSGGKIDVNFKGLASNTGTGAGGATFSNGNGSGGGYGGNGANASGANPGGVTYGSTTEPTDIGSGGGSGPCGPGGSGGGAVKLTVSGTFSIAGSLTATGGTGPACGNGGSGGGSGGSIWINTGTLSGAGTISANGGVGGVGGGGAGGGGRIALYYTTDASSVTKQTFGGATTVGGGAGTIFTKATASTTGDLLVDNNNVAGANTTMPGTVALDNLTIRNSSVFVAPASLYIAGNYVNNATFLHNGGTVYATSSVNSVASTYAGASFDTGGSGNGFPYSITFYNGFFWVVDFVDDEVYKYNTNGTYASFSFDTAAIGNDNPRGITDYNGYFFVTDNTDNAVYKYNPDGTYTGTSFALTAVDTDPAGITAANDFLWVVDDVDAEVYKYNTDGTYTGTSFDTSGSGSGNPFGIAFFNDFFWIADYLDAEVYRYNSNGTYTGVSFDTSVSGNVDSYGVASANGFLWVTDTTDAEVYKYNVTQQFSGTMTGGSSFNNVVFSGRGPKAFGTSASTTGNFTVDSGATYVAPFLLTIGGNYTNNGTFTAGNGTVYFSTTSPTTQTLSGAMTGVSAFASTTFIGSGVKTFTSSASTTNHFTINSGATVVAPPLLSVSGNYTNSGTFTHNSGRVYLNGTASQTATGTMTGASAFRELTILNTSGTGATQSVIFGTAASTTGTFTMVASTSAQFASGAATSSFNGVSWNGSAGSPVWLRSSSGGTPWGLVATNTQAVSYVNVKDSYACAGDTVNVSDGTNSGGNSCWNFATPNMELLHYRWRFDNGGDGEATSATGAEDVSLSTGIYVGDRRRLRIQVKNIGAGSASNITYRLEYALDACSAWTPVADYNAASSEAWTMDLSPYANNMASTSKYADISTPAGTFVPGYLMTVTAQTPAQTLTAAPQYTELEYSLRSRSSVTPDTTYCFRLTNAGSIANFTYTQSPQVIVRPNSARGISGGSAVEESDTPSGNVSGGGQGSGGGGEGSGTPPAPVGGGGQGGGGGDSG